MIVINKSDQTLEISKCLKKLKFAIGARGIRGGTEGGSQVRPGGRQLSYRRSGIKTTRLA